MIIIVATILLYIGLDIWWKIRDGTIKWNIETIFVRSDAFKVPEK